MSESTPRDHLIGALLQWHVAAQQFRRAVLIDGGVGELTGVEVIGALRGLLEAGEMLDAAHPAEARPVAYGLPAWLVTDSLTGAVAALDILTGSHADSLMSLRRNDGQPLLGEDDLYLLSELIATLETTFDAPLVDPSLLPDLTPDGLTTGVLAAATAPAAVGGSSLFERELNARLSRVGLPVIIGQHGLILDLDLRLSVAESGGIECEAADFNRARIGSTFHKAIRTGQVAAINLLQEIGTAPETLDAVRRLEYAVPGLTEKCPRLEQESVGLPVALHVLRVALSLPRLPYVTTGQLSTDGRLQRMATEPTRQKINAAAADGLSVSLAAFADGLGGENHFARLTGPTLKDAAHQLWGEQWRTVLASAASAQLTALGCEVFTKYPADIFALTADDGTPVGVPMPYHDQVVRYVKTYPSTPIVLGGPPSIGKTWTARSVSEALAAEGWSVRLMTFPDGRLPQFNEIRRLIELMIVLYPVEPQSSWLLVLEDLDAFPDANNLDDVLLRVSSEFGCSVLAVATAREGNPVTWQQDRLQVVGFRYDHASILDAVQRLTSAYPARFGRAAGYEGVVARASGGDMWWLVRLLDYITPETARDDPKELKEAFVEQRATGLDDAGRRAAAVLAAHSAIGITVRTTDLEPLSVTQLNRLGARELRDGQWLLPSPTAQATLMQVLDSRYSHQLSKALRETLARLLNNDDVSGVLRLLTNCSKVADGEVLEALASEYRLRLITTLAASAEPDQLASLVRLLRGGVRPNDRSTLWMQLVDQVAARGWSGLAAPHIVAILTALNLHTESAEAEAAGQDLEDTWTRILRLLDQQIPTVTSTMTPQEAIGLVNAVNRLFRWDQTNGIIRQVFKASLTNVNPEDGDDVFTAIRLIELARTLDRRNDRAGMRGAVLDSPGYRRLAAANPAIGDAYDYVAQLAACDALGRDSPSEMEVERQLQIRIPRTHPARFASALYQLRNFAPDKLALVRRANLQTATDSIMSTAPPGVLSQLIRALMRFNPRLAVALHYGADGRPNADRLDAYTTSLLELGDHRAASHLIAACAALDNEFTDFDQSFATTLVARIEPLQRTLARETRSIVVERFVAGLLESNIDTDQLERLADPMRNRIMDRFSATSGDGSEARLALLLSDDEALGESFRNRIAREFRPESHARSELLIRMRPRYSPEATMAYQQLAIAVAPDLCAEFAEQTHSRHLSFHNLRDDRMNSVLRALQATARTLSYAGKPREGQRLVRSIARDANSWGKKLGRIRSAADLRQAIDLLRKLDPDIARGAVRRYAVPFTPARTAGPPQLAALIVSGSTTPQDSAGLLAAVAKTDRQLVAELTAELRKQPAWGRRRRALVESTYPGEQGQILQDLGTAGYELGSPDLRALRQAWFDLAYLMRNPRTLSNLLTGFLSVDRQLACEFAGRLDRQALARRARLARPHDAPALAPLLVALTAAQREDIAREAVASFHTVTPPLRTPFEAARLIAAVHEIDAGVGRRLAADYRDNLLAKALTQTLVTDPDSHLLGIGWLARMIRRHDLPLPPGSWAPAAVTENRVARLWAEAWLQPGEHRLARLRTGVTEAAADPDVREPWELAALLIIAASIGEAETVLGTARDWRVAFGTGTNWLSELVQEALHDDALADLVHDHWTTVDAAADRIPTFAEIDAARLRRLLGKLAAH